jgi:predicted LPLAT superfamily acyltransferase
VTATPPWLLQKERGSSWLMRFIAFVGLGAGRATGRLLLYPICAYFVVFSRSARAASMDFLTRVRQRPCGWRDVFAHYHRFAETILDRVFLLAGRDRDFTFDVDGTEQLDHALAEGRGVLLFGAHFGSFEALRAIGGARSPARVRVLMHEANAHKLNATLGALNRSASQDVIVLGRPQTMLEVRDALRAGEIVGLLADRAVAHDRLVSCDFLGARAPFPQGPFVLASILEVPIVLFCAVCDGSGAYRVRFERFDVATADARATIVSQVQRYASCLEGKCRADPLNWFNFYDFFAQPRT